MATRSRIARLLASIVACLLGASTAWSATPAVCNGSYHGMALRSDGLVFSWGTDYHGELGSGRLLQRAAPGPVGDLQDVVAVAAGDGFGMALLSDGRVATWGWNVAGQRGDGSFTPHGNDITMARISDVAAISAGTNFAAALTRDGRLWMWGQNAYTLGDGTNQPSATPKLVEGLADVVHVSAGWGHTAAVTRDGSVWAWGDPFAVGATGNIVDGTSFARPYRIPGLDRARAVSAGNGYTLVLRDDGTVWAWGTNRYGQLGVEGITDRIAPAPVPGVTGIKAISAGDSQALALREDGTVLAWGANLEGQQGVGSTGGPLAPHTVPGLPAIAAISSGAAHVLALTASGELWGWGSNWRLQLGLAQSFASSPLRLPGLPAIQAMDAGAGFTLAVPGGRVLAWGENGFQQLASGPSPFENRTTPGAVLGLPTNVSAIACAGRASFALLSDGALWAWGSNESALLGRAPTIRSTAAPVEGLPPLASVAASGIASHALAIDREGRLWAWGANYQGQLGDGSEIPAYPALVEGLPRIAYASAGSTHSLAIATDGSVWAWGLNDHGQLGDGTRVNRLRPVRVVGLPAVVAVSGGGSHSLALGSDGRVWAWGKEIDGQLGIGPIRDLDELVPVAVESLGKATAIAAGLLHSFALLQDGSLWGWGINFFDALGDDSDQFHFDTPIRIRTDAPVTAITTASTHGAALGANGPIFAWGFNIEGQVGDGTYADRRSPVVVVGVNGAGFFNASPEKPFSIPASKLPAFGLVASGSLTSGVVAQIQFNAADIGANGNVYAFAWAPVGIVKRAAGEKADPAAACVLAQLNSGGQLQQVTASSLQAYVSGVLGAQGQAVSVFTGATASIGGATFYVGYGSSASQMLNGNNRSVVSIDATTCKPQPPQTGWWWNPAEPGRGFSIETSGNRIFFAAYMYDTSGRSTWYVASGPTGLDGSLFSGTLQSYANGQTLSGSYHAPSPAVSVGPMALAFNDASHGTLVMPGTQGPIPIERFNIVPDGLKAPVQQSQPESGWWWNEAESGRGYYIEWQGGSAFLAGYMYDDAGQPLWYVSQSATPDARAFQGSWSQYGNGQVLGGAARAPVVVNGNVAPVAIQFQGADTGVLTLPGGRQSPIRRFRF
ncbi:MAG TPA: hypothetical protein VM122_13400 [Usitatibacter sp.]|nr:hypothetical protein [Usitatibacter sp.]